MPFPRLTGPDTLIKGFDEVVKTLVPGAATAARPSPAEGESNGNVSNGERKHIARLMRINHTGEVCAQALYQGQALTAKHAAVREEMVNAAEEEIDHLVWCEQRLKELGSQPSLLNPIFYTASFTMGALAGAISDKLSLGFVAAVEDQVCKHLDEHIEQIPEQDQKSLAVLKQMLVDEQKHGDAALEAGGYDFPTQVKGGMTLLSKVMTRSTYYV